MIDSKNVAPHLIPLANFFTECFLTEGTWLKKQGDSYSLVKPLPGVAQQGTFASIDEAKERIIPQLVKSYEARGKAA